MRDLDTARAEREREIHHFGDPVDVGAMYDRIHREEEVVPHDLGRECAFPGKCARIAGDVIGGLSVAVLDGDLHMVEPTLNQCAEGLVRDPDRGGDQIGVKAGRMGAGSDVYKIAPRAGLAARQMHLQDAELRRFVEDAQPGRGIELVRPRIERERVRAIRAPERTAMS